MTCPEVERLTVFGLGEADDPDLEAHVQSCADCQAGLFIVSVLGGDGTKEVISEELISRIIAGLPEPEAAQGPDWGKGFHLLMAGMLGFLTALASLIVTGTIGSVSPGALFVLGTAFGFLSALFNLRSRAETPGSVGLEPA